jgi:outer membrane biosynthesis protein TonB
MRYLVTTTAALLATLCTSVSLAEAQPVARTTSSVHRTTCHQRDHSQRRACIKRLRARTKALKAKSPKGRAASVGHGTSRHHQPVKSPPKVPTTTTVSPTPTTTVKAPTPTPTTTTVAAPAPTTTTTVAAPAPTTTTTTTPAPSGLQTGAITASTAQLSWPNAALATTTTVSIDGQVVDEYPAGSSNSYELTELWPATSFTVAVQLNGSAGQQLALYTRTVTTSSSSGSFPRLYATSAFINQPVASSPALASNSAAMVSAAVTSASSSANFSDNADWGVPITTADAQSSSYAIGCQYYYCDHSFADMHIPTSAQPNTGSDGHLVVLQPDGSELDLWGAQHTSTGWTSASRWVESASGPANNCATQTTCGGADVANFALAAGLVRPEEIAQGHIDHALAITTPNTRQGYIACPATNSDGKHTDPNALPIGAHIQLNPSINVATLNIPSWQKVIATALQKYGAYVTDTGGSLAVQAESNLGRSYNAWAKAGVPDTGPSLASLPWSSTRILNMTQCG